VRTIATAGHVDHGKSSLVLALTGTDPDRLAEEKARQLTIDLGYAFTTLPSGREIGFVDVPGHVRFLKNMLAGVGAVDVAMLVVAADDGWMPQTEEHLQLLELLGVVDGVVVVNKADAVDADTLELAQLLVGERLAASPWADAPVVVCDALSGRGLDELRVALDAVLDAAPEPNDTGRARLWIDRAFAARGAGTVVTGTLAGGGLRTDDELVVARTGQRARVRGIESGHRRADVVEPGARVALNLVGVERHDLERGDALVHADDWVLGRVLDVALAGASADGWRSYMEDAGGVTRAELLVYAGSGEHHASARFLDDGPHFARLRVDVSLAVAPGDHLVVRDPGRAATIGGATVLDVDSTLRARHAVTALAQPLGPRLLASHGWLTLADLARRGGLAREAADALASAMVADGAARSLGIWLVAPAAVDALQARAIDLVEQRHHDQPMAAGLELATLAAALGLDAARTRALVDDIEDLTTDREVVAEVTHAPAGATSEAGAALLAALDDSPFAPSEDTLQAADPGLVRALLRDGSLVDVGGTVFTRAAVERARGVVREELAARGEVTVGVMRDRLASTRKYVVPLLEQFDREGLTRRRGDTRVAGPTAS